MMAVVRVDAAPGFEASVETELRNLRGVKNVVRDKAGNYDFLVLVETADAGEMMKMLTTRLRMLTGVKALEEVKDPSSDLIRKLA